MARISLCLSLSLALLTGCYGFVVDHRAYGSQDGATAMLSITADHRLNRLSISHCDGQEEPLVLVARRSDDPRRYPAWQVTVDAETCYEIEAGSWRVTLYKRLTLAPGEVARIEID
ncbi:hypothetical protein [Celeribacter neptunius]|uniref:Lipoprotein n=1 Tax=Celeribacter neptunius TaxID=588602 RepID=A0A1I3LSA6_9RHOB|nr:hypothetical protein [Celeribacter neptunius]SFI87622.1 hypothetical protein SAMN04487991_1129 [Celeribacter neptunius]